MPREIIEEGHGLRYSLASGLLLEEVSISPPGVKGSGPKNTTTHANSTVQTKAPGKLPEITDLGGTVVISKGTLAAAMSVVLVNQSITVTYPGGGTHVVWGWLEEVIPGPFTSNGQPTATIKIHISNRNATGVETPPVYTPPS